MLKQNLILSISMMAMVLGLKPAMAASLNASKAAPKGKLIAQNTLMTLSQTEASNGVDTNSNAAGINTSKIPLTAIAQAEEKEKAFTLTLGLERGSDLAAQSTSTDKTTTSALINPSLKLSDKLSSFAKLAVEQQENGPRNSELSDLQINLSLKGNQVTKEIASSYSLNGFAPTNEPNRKNTSFQGAGSLGAKLAGEFKLGKFSYSLSYRRNFHEFTVSNEGKANIKDTVGQAVALEIPIFSDKFKISSTGVFRNSWVYNNSLRQSFTYQADLNYSPTKELSFNIGTTNEGSAVKAGSNQTNIQFYDEKSSVVRAGVTYVL